jgi:hypothetical protein
MPNWMSYTFSNQTAAPPSSNQVRLNDVGAPATLVWIMYLTSDGFDAFYALTTIPVGSQLFVQDKNDHTLHVWFTVTGAPIDRGTYVELPVVGDEAAGTLNNNQAIVVVVLRPADEETTPPPVTPTPGPLIVAPWAQPRACYRLLVTPPAVEPLTVDDAKLLAAMNWPVTTPPDPRDKMLTDFITAARAKVENDTGRALLTQVHDIHILDTVYSIPLPMLCTPTQRVEDVTPTVTPLDVPSAVLPWPGWWYDGGCWYIPPVYAAGTVLRVTAGYPTVADLKTQAPGLYHAVGLLTAHYATLGRDVAITGAVASVNIIPEGYEDAIAPYKLVWVA